MLIGSLFKNPKVGGVLELTICLQRLKKIELSARPSAEIEFKIATGSDGGYRLSICVQQGYCHCNNN